MRTVVCCDDNKTFCDLLEILLQEIKIKGTNDIKIVKVYNADQLLQYCTDNEFDIIYLDIELGSNENGERQNGMKVAKKLKYINPKSLIIYISVYDTYYVDMVQAEPFRFIKKDASDIPCLRRELESALSDALTRLDDASKLTVVFNKREYTLELNKIKYFHSVARKIYVYGTLENMPIYFYEKMDELYEILRDKDKSFERISKSCIVNTNYVTAKGRKQVWIDDKVLSVTAKYRKELWFL